MHGVGVPKGLWNTGLHVGLFTLNRVMATHVALPDIARRVAVDHPVRHNFSDTTSGGQALDIETTSLALLAWLKDPAYAGQVEKAMKWLAESCKAGRFGSTQSTVLALRAILAYDAARARPEAAGTVQLYIDGRKAGSAVKFDKDAKATASALGRCGASSRNGRNVPASRLSFHFIVFVTRHARTYIAELRTFASPSVLPGTRT